MMQPNSGHTVSRHLASLLRNRIASGRLPSGMRMPDAAELSREYGLAPESVRQALNVLCDEGVLVRAGYGVIRVA
jgi:GntR family transcriptional regulator